MTDIIRNIRKALNRKNTRRQFESLREEWKTLRAYGRWAEAKYREFEDSALRDYFADEIDRTAAQIFLVEFAAEELEGSI